MSARAARAEERVPVGVGLAVREARHGRGVFATRRYAKGDVVELCPTITLDEDDVTGVLLDYVFKSLKQDVRLLVLGFGSLYNHSDDPNVECVEEDADTMSFVAMRAIRAGQELTIDYGEGWWEDRDLEPD